ncbi:MAG: hypothetical protein MK076_02410, partial [Flavobacteriales bacterium]|nr:hypothetical protein [Flavobacteriales bacterium]
RPSGLKNNSKVGITTKKTINGRNVIQPSDVNEMYTVTGRIMIERYFNDFTRENFIKYTKK